MDANFGLIARMIAYVRKNGSHFLVEALVNFILPFVIYNYAEAPLGEVRALLASSAPPILWSLVEFARHRRLDALSILVVSGIALSNGVQKGPPIGVQKGPLGGRCRSIEWCAFCPACGVGRA